MRPTESPASGQQGVGRSPGLGRPVRRRPASSPLLGVENGGELLATYLWMLTREDHGACRVIAMAAHVCAGLPGLGVCGGSGVGLPWARVPQCVLHGTRGRPNCCAATVATVANGQQRTAAEKSLRCARKIVSFAIRRWRLAGWKEGIAGGKPPNACQINISPC